MYIRRGQGIVDEEELSRRSIRRNNRHDSFHSINLHIEHASQDIHPRQAMQSLHDVYIRRTTRERAQRWMVNGEYSHRIMRGD